MLEIGKIAFEDCNCGKEPRYDAAWSHAHKRYTVEVSCCNIRLACQNASCEEAVEKIAIVWNARPRTLEEGVSPFQCSCGHKLYYRIYRNSGDSYSVYFVCAHCETGVSVRGKTITSAQREALGGMR
jgi:hypothetical protein